MFQQTSATFSEVISDLEQALAWLEAVGISTGTKRHATYLTTLKKIDEQWQARGDMRASDVPVDPKLMTTSAVEAFQLIRIWRAFAERQPEGLHAKLKIMAGGPVLERDENPARSGNSARDYGFELEVAAYFHRLGDVELTRGVDIVAPFQGMSLFLECKRPSSAGMVAENLDRAGDQIMGELSRTRLAGYGIPAMSVVKAAWKGGVVLKAKRMAQIHRTLRTWVERLDRDYLGPWFRKQTDERMVAALVHIPYVGEFDDAPPMAGVQLSVVARCPPGSPTHNDLEKLRVSLGVPD